MIVVVTMVRAAARIARKRDTDRTIEQTAHDQKAKLLEQFGGMS
jgi:hypothetical protein